MDINPTPKISQSLWDMERGVEALEIWKTDVLVIGGGCAGLRAAIAARQEGVDVTLVTKGMIGHGSATSFLDHLIEFSVVGVSRNQDDEVSYARDLLNFGHEVNDPKLVRLFVKGTKDEFTYLQKLGVPFESEDLMFPSHRSPRLRKGVGEFGEILLKKLAEQALALGVRMIENASVYHLNKHAYPFLCQVLVKGDLFRNMEISCKSLILATGGGGQIFSLTTNPNGSTGDGVALALELGAEITNIEFIHYLPLLTTPIKGYYILSQIITKGKFSNTRGDVYTPALPPGFAQQEPSVQQGHLLLDICEWIEQQILTGAVTKNNGVYWDGSHLHELILEKMPKSYQRLKEHGLDLLTEPAEISIGCHQMMGGVKIDTEGRTTVPGLFAAGEVTGGFQGAERLMGTGVMDGLVFGARAGKAAAQYARQPRVVQAPQPEPGSGSSASDLASLSREQMSDVKQQIKKQMDLILITKDADRVESCRVFLEELLQTIQPVSIMDLPLEARLAFAEVKHMLLVSLAFVHASLKRQESRGSFKRREYPIKKQVAAPSRIALVQKDKQLRFKVSL